MLRKHAGQARKYLKIPIVDERRINPAAKGVGRIVSDHRINRAGKRIAGLVGYDVDGAANGIAAIKRALGAAQNFHTIDVIEFRVDRGGPLQRYTVDAVCHG